MDKELLNIKIDKKFFSVVSLSDQSDDKDYWFLREPIERIQHIEVLKSINYRHSAIARLQRILSLKQLKINKKASGRHKDLDDFENLP